MPLTVSNFHPFLPTLLDWKSWFHGPYNDVSESKRTSNSTNWKILISWMFHTHLFLSCDSGLFAKEIKATKISRIFTIRVIFTKRILLTRFLYNERLCGVAPNLCLNAFNWIWSTRFSLNYFVVNRMLFKIIIIIIILMTKFCTRNTLITIKMYYLKLWMK